MSEVGFSLVTASQDEDSDDAELSVCSTDGGDVSPDGRCSCWQVCWKRLSSDPNILASVCFFLWFVDGLLVYTLRPWGEEHEPYTVIEALYVMAQIITTVGYGDKTPVYPRGMVYTLFYVIFAIVVLSSLVTALADHVLKVQHKIMEKAIKNSFSFKLGNEIQSESMSGAVRLTTPDSARRRGLAGSAQGYVEATEAEAGTRTVVELPEGWMMLIKSFGVWVFMVAVGAVFMLTCPGELDGEDFTVDAVQAVYFSVITLTTVGFGDICPKTQMAKLFCTFWMLLGVTSFASFVSSFSAVFMAQRNAERLKGHDRQTILDKMDRDRDGKVGQAEFLTYMLHRYGIGHAVDVDTLHDIVKVILQEFKDLDKDGDGELDMQELVKFDMDFLTKSTVSDMARNRSRSPG